MNEFYQNLLTPVVYQWVASHANAKKGKSCCSICFCNKNYHGTIYFHADNMIELQILDIETQENLFYLHFQMKDMKMATENIIAFFNYLQKPHSDVIEESHFTLKKELKILLSCTSGITTSYFAYLLENSLNQAEKHVIVDAVSYTELDQVQSDYDFIFLAPQISYKYPQMKAEYGNKVLMIDSIDFATGNIENILNIVMKKIEN